MKQGKNSPLAGCGLALGSRASALGNVNDAPAIATVFAQRVFRATDRLADYPRLGRVVPELGLESVREILLAGYRIIYRIKDEQIHLLTIHHGARLLDLSKITT